jgi:protein-disulfide isomerase
MPESPDLSPVRGWRIAFLVACTVGICLSADLLRLHVNVHTDPHYQSYCAMSERVNCETVALSEYAVVLGLPLSVWGLLGYLAMAALSVWGLGQRPRTRTWPFGILYWLSLFSSLVGLTLFGISHFLVESACIVCLGTYLVSFSLLLASYGALRRGGTGPVRALTEELGTVAARPVPVLVFAGAFLLLAVALELAVPPYWRVEASTGPGGFPVGQTSNGHPWIGAASPALEIVEFSDYQCPHCRRGHDEIRKLIEVYPQEVRLVHRQYPLDDACNPTLDRPFHPSACQYARMAYCAQEQDRFWEANDYLFVHGRGRARVTVDDLAEEVGIDGTALRDCLNSARAVQAVGEDLAAGRALGIRGTPTFLIDGSTYPGRVPMDVVAEALSKR